MTPNQVVAYNLTTARELRGWTQDQAADALEPYLGVRWSKASVSQAERSVAGKFIRQFEADEIIALARSEIDRPLRLTMPYSVTTYIMSLRGSVAMLPGVRLSTIRLWRTPLRS